jgi:hypothetical protein
MACLAGLESFRIEEDRPQDLDVPGLRQLLKPELVRRRCRVGEVGSDDEALEIARHQERRILQGILVAQELVIGGVEVLPLPLVLPAEESLLPDVRESLATAVFRGPLFEAERGAGGVGLGGGGVIEQVAEVQEVLLSRGPFLQLGLPPFGDELVDGHGRCLR